MIEEKIVETNETDFWAELNYQDSKRKAKGRIDRPNSPEYQLMAKLLEEVSVEVPTRNEIVSGIYHGIRSAQHAFSVKGFKDDVYVENRPFETKYLKNIQIGDKIDLLIVHVDDDNYHLQGSIAAIYESKAHQTLKALDEGLVVLAVIRSMNPAGYDIDIHHDGVTLPGFMPNTLEIGRAHV